MPKIEMPKCKTCIYFREFPGPRPAEEEGLGTCHLKPPQLMIGEVGSEIYWPVVFEDDFCGEQKEHT